MKDFKARGALVPVADADLESPAVVPEPSFLEEGFPAVE